MTNQMCLLKESVRELPYQGLPHFWEHWEITMQVDDQLLGNLGNLEACIVRLSTVM